MYVSAFVACLQLIKELFSEVQVLFFPHQFLLLVLLLTLLATSDQFRLLYFSSSSEKLILHYINTYPYDGILSQLLLECVECLYGKTSKWLF